MPDEISIEPYNSRWPLLFEEEKLTLREIFRDGNVIAIEHFGSTSVPGLPAKPIIDILIVVRAFAQAKSTYVSLLKPLEYVYWDGDPEGDVHMFFVKGMPPFGKKRTHHIHLVQYDNKKFTDRLKFRDYLHSNPQDALAYAKLKKNLAVLHPEDREAYTDAKSGFIKTIMDKIDTRQNT